MSGSAEKRFEFLEHVSDAYIEAYGRSIEEAFENAALAMFELMSDTATVEPRRSDRFQLEAHDEYALLYKWLETLLVKFEMDMILYSRFSITSIKKSNGMLTLSAKAEGETYSKEKHPTKVEVKAVTFHRMEIETKPDHVVVRYILDL
jgi:protein archease